jgi:hypothetical protein
LLELRHPAPQVFDEKLEGGGASIPVAHDGAQSGQHGARLEDPLAQARVVGRPRGRDLEAAVDGAPLLEFASAAEHGRGGERL